MFLYNKVSRTREAGAGMTKLEPRTYRGAPGERVAVRAKLENGAGETMLRLDGRKTAGGFALAPKKGGCRVLTIQVVGAAGVRCRVDIGGVDQDLLCVTRHDPSPVHLYLFHSEGGERSTTR